MRWITHSLMGRAGAPLVKFDSSSFDKTSLCLIQNLKFSLKYSPKLSIVIAFNVLRSLPSPTGARMEDLMAMTTRAN